MKWQVHLKNTGKLVNCYPSREDILQQHVHVQYPDTCTCIVHIYTCTCMYSTMHVLCTV